MGCEHECINEHRLKELESAVHEMKEKHSKRDGVFLNVSMRWNRKLLYTTTIWDTLRIQLTK